MLSKRRNKLDIGKWQLSKLEINDYNQTESFDCKKDDLNDFFRTDAINHKKELLAETYSLSFSDNIMNIALISFCNDAIIFPVEERKKFLPEKKAHYKSLPAVKIARLGVACQYQGNEIGTFLLSVSKYLFLTDNRTGCRFITVDAYNTPGTINFYQKNGFDFLHNKDARKHTRIMYYDLKRIDSNQLKSLQVAK